MFYIFNDSFGAFDLDERSRMWYDGLLLKFKQIFRRGERRLGGFGHDHKSTLFFPAASRGHQSSKGHLLPEFIIHLTTAMVSLQG